jgi:hypothetical protein
VPVIQLDKTGYAIPDSILPDWLRADETAKAMLSQISKLKSQLKAGLEAKDVIFAEVTNTSIADFTNAYSSIKCVVPYAVCTSCQGHNRKRCSLCRGRGFLSEFAWRSLFPPRLRLYAPEGVKEMAQVLRDYQKEAVAGIFSQWKDKNSTLLVMATGTGKTSVFTDVIHRIRPSRALVLAHRSELIWQAVKRIEGMGIPLR